MAKRSVSKRAKKAKVQEDTVPVQDDQIVMDLPNGKVRIISTAQPKKPAVIIEMGEPEIGMPTLTVVEDKEQEAIDTEAKKD